MLGQAEEATGWSPDGEPQYRSGDRRASYGSISETPLISSGLVDSFSLIKVLAFIEDEFGVVIPDEAATANAMDSIERILNLMEAYAGGDGPNG